MKAGRSQNHLQLASGGLLGGSWAAPGPEAFLQKYPRHLGPPGVCVWFREPSGDRPWALLARLLALPGFFFGSSGAVSGAIR